MYKKIISAVLAITLTVGAAGLPAEFVGGATDGIAISASAAIYGDYKYKTLSDGTVEISEYIGNDTTVKIPSEINGKTVTSIGGSAFDGSIKENCHGITSITIPDSVTTIGACAFQGCFALTSITIPDGVKTIDGGAFRDDGKLEKITIPNSVTAIGWEAFRGTAIKSIKLPDGLKTLEYGVLAECENLTSLNIPNSVTEIGYVAFSSCKNLKEITIPNNVTYIGNSAFAYCSSLKKVTISESISQIDDYAFHDCTSLKSVTIPKSAKTIGEEAFGYNYNLSGNSSKVSGFKISCYAGTAGETYAKKNGFDYALITSTDVLSVDRVTTNGFTSKTNSVTVKWNKVSGASGYRIYKYNASTKKWSTLTTIKNGNTLSYTQSGLKSGTVYKYKVKAYVKKNNSTTWGESSETLATATKPTTVKFTKTKSAKTSVRLYWGKVTGADGYRLQKYDTAKKKWVSVNANIGSDVTNYKVTGLSKNKSYKFRIQAFKKVGGTKIYGAWSSEKTVKTTK